jgi:hypothetical protein
MPAYAYPIQIKREPQKVKYQKQFELESALLTLSELRKYVSEDEQFAINEEGEPPFGDKIVLHVYGYRMETNEELRTRVAKEEAYMEEYNKRHKK